MSSIGGLNPLIANQDLLELQRLQLQQQQSTKGGGKKSRVHTKKLQQLAGKQRPPQAQEVAKLVQTIAADKLQKMNMQKLLQIDDPGKLMSFLQQAGFGEEQVALLLKLQRTKGKDGKNLLEELAEILKKKRLPFEKLSDQELAELGEYLLRHRSKDEDEGDPNEQKSASEEDNEASETLTVDALLSAQQRAAQAHWHLALDQTKPEPLPTPEQDALGLESALKLGNQTLQKVIDWVLKSNHPKKRSADIHPISSAQIVFSTLKVLSALDKFSDWISTKKGGERFIKAIGSLKKKAEQAKHDHNAPEAVATLTESLMMGQEVHARFTRKGP